MEVDKTGEAYQNCWEYWHCKPQAQEKCPVYKDKDGKRCWVYLHSLGIFDWAEPKLNFKDCKECPWYKKVNNIVL